MKKLLVLVLLVPILALTMISCDADMRSSLAGFMDGLGGNVYADAGLIEVNTAQVEAATATVAAIGTGAGAEPVTDSGDGINGTTSSMGVSVTVPKDTTLLAPQTPAKQKELKDNLGDALNSDTQKKQLLEDLKKPVTDKDQKKAAQGTVKVFNASLDQIKGDLPADSDLGKTLEKLKLPEIADGDDLTQGDMLALQLMTDLIANTVATLESIGGGSLGGVNSGTLEAAGNKDKVLSIIDDALFAAEMAEQISGAASIDFTGQIDLGDLLDGLNKGTKSRGETVSLEDAEDFISTINDLAPTIVELMGITYNTGTEVFEYTDSAYKSFLLNQWIYRSSMEQALKMMSLGKLEKKDIDSLTFDTSTLVKYTLAVFVTEHDAFVKSGGAAAPNPETVILAYLNYDGGGSDNKKLGLGTLTSNSTLTQPDILGADFYAAWPGFIKNGELVPAIGATPAVNRSLSYYQEILENIIVINKAGGIAQLTTELEEFRDAASTEDGLTKWYNEL